MKKEKIGLIIFGMFVMYIIVITYGLIFTLINKDDFVTLDNNTVYEDVMKRNSERIKVFKTIELNSDEQNCLDGLNNLLNESLETYVFGEVNMTEFTKDNFTITSDGLLTYYTGVIGSCDLNDIDKNITNTYIINSQYFYENLIEKYRFNHEINFKNILNNQITATTIDVLGYKYAKISESLTIDYILDNMEAKYE